MTGHTPWSEIKHKRRPDPSVPERVESRTHAPLVCRILGHNEVTVDMRLSEEHRVLNDAGRTVRVGIETRRCTRRGCTHEREAQTFVYE